MRDLRFRVLILGSQVFDLSIRGLRLRYNPVSFALSMKKHVRLCTAALVPKKLIMATMMFLLQYPNISADIIRDLDICEPDVLSNKRWITCKT